MIQRKTLIIGGAGYIGLVITDKLLDEGHNVCVADNLIYGHEYALRSFILKENFSFINFDYTKNNIREFPDIKTFGDVIVLAGLVGDPVTKKYPNYSSDVNGKIKLKTMVRKNKDMIKIIFIELFNNNLKNFSDNFVSFFLTVRVISEIV